MPATPEIPPIRLITGAGARTLTSPGALILATGRAERNAQTGRVESSESSTQADASPAYCRVPASVAAQEVYPLPSSAIVGTLPENTAPFLLPARCVQTKLADRNTLAVTQGLPWGFGVWDMLSIGPNSVVRQ
jgi:hypothetical protein